MKIIVSINFTKNPPQASFTACSVDKQNHLIRWVRAADQTFTFVAVNWDNGGKWGSMNPPFSNSFIPEDGATMMVADFNEPNSPLTAYYYQIEVEYDGTFYFFPASPSPIRDRGDGDPSIENK